MLGHTLPPLTRVTYTAHARGSYLYVSVLNLRTRIIRSQMKHAGHCASRVWAQSTTLQHCYYSISHTRTPQLFFCNHSRTHDSLHIHTSFFFSLCPFKNKTDINFHNAAEALEAGLIVLDALWMAQLFRSLVVTRDVYLKNGVLHRYV